MTSSLRFFREAFVVDLFTWRPRVLIVRLCVFCSVAVASVYLLAALAYSVSPNSPYDFSESVGIAAFTAALIAGVLLGGAVIARAESVVENQARIRLIGLSIFLVTAIAGSLAGLLFMVLVPLVFIPSVIVLTFIVISGRYNVSTR